MPPFAGTPIELEALVQFISWNTAGTPPEWDVSENPETLRQIRGWLEEVGTAPGIALSAAHWTGGAD